MIPTLHGPHFGPLQGDKPQALVILLHGFGSDGHDLISLTDKLAPQAPHALFLSPHAPYRCDQAPSGYQWFSLQDTSPKGLLTSVQEAVPILKNFLDQQLNALTILPSRCLILGFSQGANLALHIGFRYSPQLAGIIAFSGWIAGPENFAEEIKERPPTLLIHGEHDSIVPAVALEKARETLEATDVSVEACLRPGLAHSIDSFGIERAGSMIARHLS